VAHHEQGAALVSGKYCADTRSKALAGGGVTARSVRVQAMRASGAMAAARVIAVCEMSTAVTSQPLSASHRASAPSPQPTSRACPGARSVISVTSTPFGLPLNNCSRLP
jgi:hypothetical protein